MNSPTPHEDSTQEFLALYKAADPFKQFVVRVLIKAGTSNDTAPLHKLIRLCPHHEDVKAAARLMIAAIEKELVSKKVQA
ncbi:hypothetical protein SAMN02745130_01069 [Thiothrix eikelboomii]|uniref:Uncharacterized protein n=1 Tax=Thiothrix eikelboomii TaxID=92487 RepID=A0A1T4W587_9GAMM|nr:hypothetical protein [Thiothrix eikelboomii]SKA72430.1 hypothetical protein SAMN02745130_01069 [Thiothrix eikelboomii]